MDIAITFPNEQIEATISQNPESVEATVSDSDTIISQISVSDSIVMEAGADKGVTVVYDENEDRVTAIIA